MIELPINFDFFKRNTFTSLGSIIYYKSLNIHMASNLFQMVDTEKI